MYMLHVGAFHVWWDAENQRHGYGVMKAGLSQKDIGVMSVFFASSMHSVGVSWESWCFGYR